MGQVIVVADRLSDKQAGVKTNPPQPVSTLTMSLTRDFGKRVELVSMDGHFRQITIALYQQSHHNRPEYLVHSYSRFEGASERIHFVRHGMKVLGQLEISGDWLSFSCGSPHLAAARRTFLETCKMPSTVKVETRPLSIIDKKSGRGITAVSLGNGRYQIGADGPEDGKSARVEGIVAGS